MYGSCDWIHVELKLAMLRILFSRTSLAANPLEVSKEAPQKLHQLLPAPERLESTLPRAPPASAACASSAFAPFSSFNSGDTKTSVKSSARALAVGSESRLFSASESASGTGLGGEVDLHFSLSLGTSSSGRSAERPSASARCRQASKGHRNRCCPLDSPLKSTQNHKKSMKKTVEKP